MSECRAFKECYFKADDEKKEKETNFFVKIFHIKTCNSIDNGYLLFTLQRRLFVCLPYMDIRGVQFGEDIVFYLKSHFVEIFLCFFSKLNVIPLISSRLRRSYRCEIRNVPVTKIGKLYHSSFFLSLLCVCLVSFLLFYLFFLLFFFPVLPVAWSHFACWDGKFWLVKIRANLILFLSYFSAHFNFTFRFTVKQSKQTKYEDLGLIFNFFFGIKNGIEFGIKQNNFEFFEWGTRRCLKAATERMANVSNDVNVSECLFHWIHIKLKSFAPSVSIQSVSQSVSVVLFFYFFLFFRALNDFFKI